MSLFVTISSIVRVPLLFLKNVILKQLAFQNPEFAGYQQFIIRLKTCNLHESVVLKLPFLLSQQTLFQNYKFNLIKLN